MKANLSRKSFLLSLAACPFLMNPTPVFANGLSAGTDGSDGINVKSNGDETIITIVATGEWVSFYGMLKNSGDEIALLFSDGKPSMLLERATAFPTMDVQSYPS